MNYDYFKCVKIVFVTFALCLTTMTHSLTITPVYIDEPDKGFNDPELGPTRKQALEFAFTIWEEALEGDIPIRIAVKFEPMYTYQGEVIDSTLASSLTRPSIMNRSKLIPGVAYPHALASQLIGSSVALQEFNDVEKLEIGTHGSITFNEHGDLESVNDDGFLVAFKFDYSVDGTCLQTRRHFVSLVLHEVGHILGFAERVSVWDGSFTGRSGRHGETPSVPAIYDTFLSACRDSSDDLGNPCILYDGHRINASKTDDLQWKGSSGNAYARHYCKNNRNQYIEFCHEPGGRLKLHANGSVSSVSHVYEGGLNLLMDPTSSCGEVNVGLDVTPFMLKDMGWRIKMKPKIAVTPDKVKFENVTIGATEQAYLKIENLEAGELVVHAVELKANYTVPFTLTSCTLPRTLTLGESFNIGVEYTPTREGLDICSIEITSSDMDNSPLKVLVNAYNAGFDTDGDGLPDSAETKDYTSGSSKGYWNPFDPNNPDSTGDAGQNTGDGIFDGANDYDGDNVDNATEYIFGLDPTDAASCCETIDSDGDGLDDFQELRDLDLSTSQIENPFDLGRFDTDADGLSDYEDDYDGDGIENGVEFEYFGILNPILADTSGDNGALGPDGIVDGDNDFDGDGIPNSTETRYGLDPTTSTTIDDIVWSKCPSN